MLWKPLRQIGVIVGVIPRVVADAWVEGELDITSGRFHGIHGLLIGFWGDNGVCCAVENPKRNFCQFGCLVWVADAADGRRCGEEVRMLGGQRPGSEATLR